MLQVGSTDSPSPPPSRSTELAVIDPRELADMPAEHGFRMAYEPWWWATLSPTWEDCWEVVKAVDRPNCGLCLDTFQIAGGEYADPTADNGLVAGVSPEELGKKFADSLYELSKTVSGDKVYLVHISDGKKPK